MNPSRLAGAACTTDDPEMWFAPKNSAEVARAKELCGLCKVRTECLNEQLEIEGNLGRGYRHGIFGGRTGPERHLLYLKRKRAAAGGETS